MQHVACRLETLQCMVERRRGGETGVKWVQAYRGDAFWKAHQEGVWAKDLVDAALCRSHTLKPAREGFNHVFPGVSEMRTLVKDPASRTHEPREFLQPAREQHRTDAVLVIGEHGKYDRNEKGQDRAA